MRDLNYPKLKQEIGEPDWWPRLEGLWQFAGQRNPHHWRAKYLGVYAMYLSECETFGVSQKFLMRDNLHHVCGMHHKVQRMGLIGIVSRIRARPEVAGLHPGFDEYLEWICPSPYQYNTIGSMWDTGEPRDHVMQYPYIRGAVREEHETLLKIHAMLPKGMEADFKGEICQDVFVALLSGEVTMENLPDHLERFKRRARKNMPEYGTRSLDEEIVSSGRAGKPGLTRKGRL